MYILGLDTSSTDLSVCVSEDGAPLSTVCRYIKNSHAEHITQAVELALSLAGVCADDVTHVAVSKGPGSFTGLRIGLSFVKGFCMMTERKVLPLSSLMVLAHAAGERKEKIFTALDARQGSVHYAAFVWEDKTLRRLTDDCVSPPENLLRELAPTDILLADTMGYTRSTVFKEFPQEQILDVEKLPLNRAHSCAALAYTLRDDKNAWQSADQIVPNYLQGSVNVPPISIV